MNDYNIINNLNTICGLIEAGYQKVSKSGFQKQQDSGQYSTKILQTFCRRGEEGKVYKISEKRFKKLESSGADVFIKNKYFSKKIEEQQPDKESQELSASSPLGTLQILPAELIAYTFGFLSPCKLNQVKTVSSQFCKIALDQISLQPVYKIARNNLEFARPYLFPNFEGYSPIIMKLYFDSEGYLQGYWGNLQDFYGSTPLYYGREGTDQFNQKE
jgi:hypothetical protein